MTTAYLFIGEMILNCGDRELEQAVNYIALLKLKKRLTYNSLYKIPFIQDIFDMVNDEFDYRSHEIQEENASLAYNPILAE
jgi:hypothetical protein